MSPSTPFLTRLESKVKQQLGSQHVGYLIGAGASYLDGTGYPLASDLWNHITRKIRNPERDEIQAKLDAGASGIEHALDLLDDGAVIERPHRHLVTEAIADHFISLSPSIETHRLFINRLALRQEINVPVFCLNYDGLIERAADAERHRIVDGFLGVERPFFAPQTFQEWIALPHRGPRKPQADWRMGTIQLYKLHGSVGWFYLGSDDIRRLGFGMSTPAGARRLMVPPQHRKAADTTLPPYSALWSDFRMRLCHGPHLINRLVTIGYGLQDEHVNAVIDSALARKNFTLIAFAQRLSADVLNRWSSKKNVVLVTNDQCALYGEIGPGHPILWNFEEVAGRV